MRGECSMCDYQIAAPMGVDPMVANLREALEKREHYDSLFVAPLGSMFDDKEVPPEARRRIFALAAGTGCTLFATESRIEFLNEHTIGEFADLLGDRGLRVNVGLESADPFVLSNCIGKALDLASVRPTARLLEWHGVELASNVLLGALALAELEAIEAAVATVRWAFENGSRLCVLFPSNVKRWTLQHWLWERGLFRPPSLWALIEVLERLQDLPPGALALSYFAKVPNDSIVEVPTTCPACHTEVLAALRVFSIDGDFAVLAGLLRRSCSCRAPWLEKLHEAPQGTLSERFERIETRVALEILGASSAEMRPRARASFRLGLGNP